MATTNIKICTFCKKTIQADFNFCPWCGENQGCNIEKVLDEVFVEIQELQKKDRLKRIAQMKEFLENIEKDLPKAPSS